MISLLIAILFILGYAAIALEHPLRVNKAASALLTGVLCWLVYMLGSYSHHEVTNELFAHFAEIASILFFLLGAMTIVEVIDSHNGFEIITSRISTKSMTKLLLIISVITFFLSSVLDNLTTAIVMTSLCNKLLKEKEDRLWFAGMIVIAANAGGAWSPLGDVTTTMLWIGGQITAWNIIVKTLLPAVAVMVFPLILLSMKFRDKKMTISSSSGAISQQDMKEGGIILLLGIGLLLFVPVFKTLTHLPPFMGMLLALGCLWIIIAFIHFDKEESVKKKLTVAHALQRIDVPSILFFLGILLAVAALQVSGMLKASADFLSVHLNNHYLIGTALGVLSAIIDNVPLVAAAQGMYDLSTYPQDHSFWEFLALTTGTGGSMIIIGSAAGVAVMGIEQISFGWYLKKISWLALVGFAAGILFYIMQETILGM